MNSQEQSYNSVASGASAPLSSLFDAARRRVAVTPEMADTLADPELVLEMHQCLHTWFMAFVKNPDAAVGKLDMADHVVVYQTLDSLLLHVLKLHLNQSEIINPAQA